MQEKYKSYGKEVEIFSLQSSSLPDLQPALQTSTLRDKNFPQIMHSKQKNGRESHYPNNFLADIIVKAFHLDRRNNETCIA